jgi:predicted RNA-binding Zn-ribbon protein involved in translation (DUF1610 family)
MRKDVTARTIAGVLASIILAGLWWLFGNLSAILWNIWSIATYSIPTPLWLIVLLSGATLFLIFGLFTEITQRKREPSWLDLRELCYKGVRWQWQWYRSRVTALRPYCSSCGRLMQYEERDVYSTNRTIFHCQQCGEFPVKDLYRQIESEVEIEIEHIINTERWKELVKNSD